ANGIPRLQKPPLNYWLTAICYEIFGVNKWSGRAPTALAAWLLLAIVYRLTNWLFDPRDRRAGLFAAALLLGSLLFYRFMRLAETDALAALFVTAAIAAWWRASDIAHPVAAGSLDDDVARASRPCPGAENTGETPVLRNILWWHLGAAATALAAMSKGPPAAFPLLFLLAICATARTARPLRSLLRSGALLTFLAIAGPWFAYIYFSVGFARIIDEVDVVTNGRDHPNWFWIYIPYILYAVLPWTAFVIAGIADAAGRLRDPRRLGLLLWSLAILLPLCAIGNKQNHYLLPLLPPLMMLAGVWIAETLRPGASPQRLRLARLLLIVTCATIALIAPGLIVAGWQKSRVWRATDACAAAVVLALAAIAFFALFRRGLRAGFITTAAAAALAMVVMNAFWAPTVRHGDWNEVAASVRRRGADGWIAYGPANLRLCYALQQTIPMLKTPDELQAALTRHPALLVLVMKKHAGATDAMRILGLREAVSYDIDDEEIGLFQHAPGELHPPPDKQGTHD
ncbi:MAG TPA: glycosyltransferase family 39 protein, partial [Tepidisphaeraceae bacterium]